jgi:pyrroloquinoline quinone biosynthesis protein B
VLLNASPDLRQQLVATPELAPRDFADLRGSPIKAVVLTNADVDHIAGLICLREGHRFEIHASERILAVLAQNSVFNVINPELVPRKPLPLGSATRISGLTIEAFVVPGKIALYLEDASAGSDFGSEAGDTIGLEIRDGRSRVFYIPGCARLDEPLKAKLAGADLLAFDGTLFTDDEMIRLGLSHKTGQRMGHMSMSGPGGSLAAFAGLGIRRRIFVHMNNSNPALSDGSPEQAEVRRAGWDIAHDGMEVRL